MERLRRLFMYYSSVRVIRWNPGRVHINSPKNALYKNGYHVYPILQAPFFVHLLTSSVC